MYLYTPPSQSTNNGDFTTPPPPRPCTCTHHPAGQATTVILVLSPVTQSPNHVEVPPPPLPPRTCTDHSASHPAMQMSTVLNTDIGAWWSALTLLTHLTNRLTRDWQCSLVVSPHSISLSIHPRHLHTAPNHTTSTLRFVSFSTQPHHLHTLCFFLPSVFQWH